MIYNYPDPDTPQSADAFSTELCLSGFFNYPKNVSKSGCCALYKLPYHSEDVFKFFTQSTPDSVELFDENGSTISGISFSGNLVTIDFSTITAQTVKVYIDDQCMDFCFGKHVAPEPDCCDGLSPSQSVILSSEWCERDLLDNDYKVEGYTNRVRIKALFYEIDQPEPEVTRNEKGRMTKKTVKKHYELLTQPILRNSFIYNHLKESIFTGENILVQPDVGENITGNIQDSITDIKGDWMRFKVKIETLPENIAGCC